MKLEEKYTQNRQIINGKNDLLTWCKEHGEEGQTIIKEWHAEKNGSMTLFKAGSTKLVFWKCSICGEEYQKAIRFRVNGNMHEPCGRKKGKKKLIEYHRKNLNQKNSLAYCRPDLLTEWDYNANSLEGSEPEFLSVNSGKKVNWICKNCGRPYKKIIRQRIYQEYGCKLCRKAIKKENKANKENN